MQGQDSERRENDPRMHSVTDEELMLQVRDGAGETLGVLFERYHVPLYNFYTKLTGDRALSEDLVQEVFLRILRHRQTFRLGTPFRAWIYQIARNARIDHFRKSRPQVPFEPEMAPAVAAGDPAQQQQESEMLHRALMELPEEKRELLVLCRFQELPYEEVARLVGCGVPTVKVRIHRALQELRQAFHQLQAAPANSAQRNARQNFPPRRLGHEV
jgi:RNA polymerase sigma-70 factor (ECF subfamily)